MPSASALLLRATQRQLDHYHGVFERLEDAFNAYEAGQTSISAYAEVVGELAQAVSEQRAVWLWLCDWSVVLGWINRAERTAYRDTVAALDWCREWALQQRGAHVTACLEQAQRGGAEAQVPEMRDERWRMAA